MNTPINPTTSDSNCGPGIARICDIQRALGLSRVAFWRWRKRNDITSHAGWISLADIRDVIHGFEIDQPRRYNKREYHAHKCSQARARALDRARAALAADPLSPPLRLARIELWPVCADPRNAQNNA